MKVTTTDIVLASIILVLIGVIFVGVTEMNDINRTQQKTIDGLREANKKEADSLTRNLKLTQDSLKYAFETIELAHLETLKAKALTLQAQKYYHMIKFVQHTDSSRTAELKTLYKTYTP